MRFHLLLATPMKLQIKLIHIKEKIKKDSLNKSLKLYTSVLLHFLSPFYFVK